MLSPSFPDCHPVGSQHQQAGNNPRYRINGHQYIVAPPYRRHDIDPHHPEQTSTEDRQQGWSKRLAHPPQRRTRNLIAAGNELQGQHNVHAKRSIMMHHRHIGKESQKEITLPGKEPVERGTERHARTHANPEHTMHTVHPSGPIILGNETDGRSVEPLNQKIAIILEIDRSGRTGNRIGSVTVDGRLHHHIGDGEYHPLQAGRHSDAQHAVQLRGINLHLAELQAERFFFLAQQPDNQRRTHCIGNSRRHSHSCHSHAETKHKQQIQQRIDYPGNNQNIKRTTRIAHASQNRRSEVECHDERHSQEIDAQIRHGLIQHIRGGSHPRQNRLGSHLSQHQQKESAQQGHQFHRVNGTAYAPVVTLADVIGDNGTGSHRNAHKQVDKQPDDRCVAANCCQGFASHKMPHHSHIDRIKKLL